MHNEEKVFAALNKVLRGTHVQTRKLEIILDKKPTPTPKKKSIWNYLLGNKSESNNTHEDNIINYEKYIGPYPVIMGTLASVSMTEPIYQGNHRYLKQSCGTEVYDGDIIIFD